MSIFGFVLIFFAPTSAFAQSVQTPPAMTAEAQALGDRFAQVLEEECPISVCNPIGCEVTRFLTLDETQDSSLPGLGTSEPTPKNVQYKLASVRCEFSFEPTFDEAKLAGLRQRILQRVKQGGISLQLISRKLVPKENLSPVTDAMKEKDDLAKPQTPGALILGEFAPFLPWISMLLILGTILILSYWFRFRLKSKRDQDKALSELPVAVPSVISAGQLLQKTAYLKSIYQEQRELSELALRPLLEQGDLDELCRILKHFGPEVLSPYKERGQFEERLDALATRYQDYTGDEPTEEFWQFLERSERRLTAAKIRLSSDPLSYEFEFMDRMQVDELIALLRELTELEGLAIVVHGPQRLRQELFASAGPNFVSKFIEYLTGHERFADQFVRMAAQKAKKIYVDKGGSLRIVPMNKLPLLEDALNSLDSKDRAVVLEELHRAQPQALSTMAPKIFLDASLEKMPSEVLTEAFLQVSPKAAAAYIDSLEGQVNIMPKLKPRLQESIKAYLGATLIDRTLVKESRQVIAQFIKEKDAQGVIDLAKINQSLLS